MHSATDPPGWLAGPTRTPFDSSAPCASSHTLRVRRWKLGGDGNNDDIKRTLLCHAPTKSAIIQPPPPPPPPCTNALDGERD